MILGRDVGVDAEDTDDVMDSVSKALDEMHGRKCEMRGRRLTKAWEEKNCRIRIKALCDFRVGKISGKETDPIWIFGSSLSGFPCPRGKLEILSTPSTSR